MHLAHSGRAGRGRPGRTRKQIVRCVVDIQRVLIGPTCTARSNAPVAAMVGRRPCVFKGCWLGIFVGLPTRCKTGSRLLPYLLNLLGAVAHPRGRTLPGVRFARGRSGSGLVDIPAMCVPLDCAQRRLGDFTNRFSATNPGGQHKQRRLYRRAAGRRRRCLRVHRWCDRRRRRTVRRCRQ